MPNSRVGCRVVCKGCRAAPVRSCLVMGIVPWKFRPLVRLELEERSSTPDDELNSRHSFVCVLSQLFLLARAISLGWPVEFKAAPASLYMAEGAGGDPE